MGRLQTTAVDLGAECEHDDGVMGSGARRRVVIRQLGSRDESEAMAAHEELVAEGYAFLPRPRRDAEAWDAYLERMEYEKTPAGLPDGLVPWTNIYLAEDGVLAGGLSLRHELTPWLLEVGGHVGYCVRPRFRRRGHASRLLAAGLELAAEIDLDRVLVTCDLDNVGSVKVIERADGVLEDIRPVPDQPEAAAKRRYWIST